MDLLVILFMPDTNNHKAWVLIIYAVSAGTKEYLEQVDLLNGDAQSLQAHHISWEQYILDNKTALCFHKQRITADFTIVLNDGNNEEKFRSTKPVLPAKIYELTNATLLNNL